MISFPFFNQFNTSKSKRFSAKNRIQQEPKVIKSYNFSRLSNILPLTNFPNRSSSSTNKKPPKAEESPYSRSPNSKYVSSFTFESQSRLKTSENPSNPKTLMIFPMPTKTLLQCFSEYLTDYEKEEVLAYYIIYYFGNNCLCKAKTLPELDDDHGNYIAKQGDHIVYRYEIFNILGKGTFANTFKCFDHKQKQFCAIKIIKNNKRFQLHSEKEVKILKKIKEHNADKKIGIVHMLDHFRFRKHYCIVFELLDMSLLQHLKLNNRRSFPIEVCKSFTRCLLNSLEFLHSLRIIHSDLKPSNLVFSSDTNNPLKIIDFGTSSFFEDLHSSYIQSRYYRAPEVILKIGLTQASDMWSLGCVVYELVTGCILFQGKNENEVLKLIVKYKGKPPQDMINCSGRESIVWGEKSCDFEFGDKGLVNFLERKFYVGCLEWQPLNRLSASEGLLHNWLNKY